jgi:hypothetical protein
MHHTELSRWLAGQIGQGPGKKYSNGRDLSLAMGFDPRLVNDIIAEGRTSPDTLAAIARKLGYPVGFVFEKAGWGPYGDTGTLNPEEARVLALFQMLPRSHQRMLLKLAESYSEKASEGVEPPPSPEAP